MYRTKILGGIRKLRAGEAFDDAELAAVLEAHGCYALLGKMPCGKMSAAIFAAMNNGIVKARFAECAPVFAELDDIPYAVIKGAVLSKQIYHSPAMRKSGDIDLLIAPEYLDRVKSILKSRGFIQGRVIGDRIIPYTRAELIYQKAYTHQAAAYVKETGNSICPFVNVDVNLDIFWGESKVRADMRDFLSHMETTELYGVRLKKLSPVYECISLCMHHYKDLNSLYLLADGEIPLALFCDIDGYFTRVQPDVHELKQACDSIGVTEYAAFCIYHTNRIFPSEIMEKYIDAFMVDFPEDRFDRIGLGEDEYRILDGGVSRWVFDEGFREHFASLLSDRDRAKIETNRRFM